MKIKHTPLLVAVSIFSLVCLLVYIRAVSTGWPLVTFAFFAVVLLLTINALLIKRVAVSEHYLASARQEERKRIAADLHDEAGPLLALIKFQLDALECIGAESDRTRKKAMEDLDELSRKLRDIMRGLTNIGSGSRLIAQVEELVIKLKSVTGIPIFFEYQLTPELNEEQSLDCYRLIQETLNNALKHGGASEIFVSIYKQDGVLKITCRDNGKGFDYTAAVRQNRGMGLRNIAWRMKRLNGNYFVDSTPGSGSAFRYEISLT